MSSFLFMLFNGISVHDPHWLDSVKCGMVVYKFTSGMEQLTLQKWLKMEKMIEIEEKLYDRGMTIFFPWSKCSSKVSLHVGIGLGIPKSLSPLKGTV